MCQELPTRFSLIPGVPPCACGEFLETEAERDAGACFQCQAEEAGMAWPAPRPQLQRLTAHQIDVLCGVTHRRKTA